ncbi:MAG: LCP family protein [Lachnospiraceae bacterium]|nr:LCP family protein [Lachnospiraceae bacterium]
MQTVKKKRDRAANLEKEQILNPGRVKKKKKARLKRVLLIVLLSIVSIVIIGAIVFQIIRMVGRSNLAAKAATAAPVLEALPYTETVTDEEKEAVKWQEGWVKYKDKIWSYNKDILTFLIMGIDKSGDAREVAEGTNGGQADGLFLLVINPHRKSIQIFAINRNAMTDVDVYNEDGAYVRTVKSQICTQHGFGNGVEESCEYQKKTVERFLYQLPIHGYAAINMTSVPTINDAVGGVDVKVLEDMTKWDKSLVKDAEVHLEGDTAYVYTTRRDTKIAGSADGRLKRQKQFLTAFMAKAVQKVKSNPTSAIDLYNALTSQMTTDVTADEVMYLAPLAAGYHFDSDILTMEGETVLGDDGFEEFHADEEALYRQILEIFYEPVET